MLCSGCAGKTHSKESRFFEDPNGPKQIMKGRAAFITLGALPIYRVTPKYSSQYKGGGIQQDIQVNYLTPDLYLKKNKFISFHYKLIFPPEI